MFRRRYRGRVDVNPRPALQRAAGLAAEPIRRLRRPAASRRPRPADVVGTGTGLPPVRSWAAPLVRAVLVRPGLWAIATRQLFVLAAPGWWQRRPFLPLPDPAYLHFRLVTQYGDGGHPPEPADVVTYLRWCRALRADQRAEPGHPPGDDRLPF
jgi:hypothetical protein